MKNFVAVLALCAAFLFHPSSAQADDLSIAPPTNLEAVGCVSPTSSVEEVAASFSVDGGEATIYPLGSEAHTAYSVFASYLLGVDFTDAKNVVFGQLPNSTVLIFDGGTACDSLSRSLSRPLKTA